MLKKNAAAPGVIGHSDTGPGDGDAIAAALPGAGAEIGPIDSTLLGDGRGQAPAAEPKAAAGLPESTADPARSDAPADAAADAQAEPAAAAPADGAPDAAPDTPAGTAPSAFDRAPAAAATVSPASPTVRVQKTGFWPVVLGGVVAAALGSAATIWASGR